MSGWKSLIADDPLPWLLEADNPSVRYFALRELLDRGEDDAEVKQAQAAIMASAPVASILGAQQAEGYWVKPGPGYTPKYTSTVWSLMFLAQLGADGSHPQIQRGCEYLLALALAKNGAFSVNATPSVAIDCLNGNLLHALLWFGYGDDPRVQNALQRLAQNVQEKGFRCPANAKLPCAWGAVKTLLAFGLVPQKARSRDVQAAIDAGTDFMLRYDLSKADYPYRERISSVWFKFGFPLGYTSDILQALMVMTALGHGSDPRLKNAVDFMLSKQDAPGRWKLENSLNGKMWADIEKKGRPSKWVTLNALRVLKRAFG